MHYGGKAQQWHGWRIKGPRFPLTVILTKPIDRTKLAERERIADRDDDE